MSVVTGRRLNFFFKKLSKLTDIKIKSYLNNLKAVAFSGSYQDLENRPNKVEDCLICNIYDDFYIDSGCSKVLNFPYPGGSFIRPTQFLLVIRSKKVSTDTFYGATAKLITVQSLSWSGEEPVATGNVDVLNLGATSNTGYTLTAGVEKLTIKASSGYEVKGYCYAVNFGN